MSKQSSANAKSPPEKEPDRQSWSQRHGGLVFLLLVSGIIGFALLYEFLRG